MVRCGLTFTWGGRMAGTVIVWRRCWKPWLDMLYGHWTTTGTILHRPRRWHWTVVGRLIHWGTIVCGLRHDEAVTYRWASARQVTTVYIDSCKDISKHIYLVQLVQKKNPERNDKENKVWSWIHLVATKTLLTNVLYKVTQSAYLFFIHFKRDITLYIHAGLWLEGAVWLYIFSNLATQFFMEILKRN